MMYHASETERLIMAKDDIANKEAASEFEIRNPRNNRFGFSASMARHSHGSAACWVWEQQSLRKALLAGYRSVTLAK